MRLNLAQQARSFAAYHFGKVFRLTPHGASEEKQSLAGLLYGPRARRGLRLGEETPQGFLECKGLVEGLLDLLHLRELVGWSTDASGVLHPGRSAALHCNDEKIGYLGPLHPDLGVGSTLSSAGLLLFELDFDTA